MSAAERARWLAELAEALDHAHQIALEIGLNQFRCPEAMELQARLAAARAQVKGLRLSRTEDRFGELDPEWIKSLWPNTRVGTKP